MALSKRDNYSAIAKKNMAFIFLDIKYFIHSFNDCGLCLLDYTLLYLIPNMSNLVYMAFGNVYNKHSLNI